MLNSTQKQCKHKEDTNMASKTVVQPDAEEAVKWLKANPKVLKQSIKALKLGDQRLSDAIALRPQTLLDLATNTYKAAVAAGAPRDVLFTLKTRRDLTRAGLTRLPKFAYSWLSICQLRGVESKAKARSILAKAASASPDKANQEALLQVAKSIAARPGGGGGQASLPCLLCCAISCLECGPFCIICCVFGCLICLILD
jgi:hypothetical protein